MVKPDPEEHFTDPASGLTPERLAKYGHKYELIDSNCWAAEEYDTPRKIIDAYDLPEESLQVYTTGDICNFSQIDVPLPLHLLYCYKQLKALQLIPLAPGSPSVMSYTAVLAANSWSHARVEEDWTWGAERRLATGLDKVLEGRAKLLHREKTRRREKEKDQAAQKLKDLAQKQKRNCRHAPPNQKKPPPRNTGRALPQQRCWVTCADALYGKKGHKTAIPG